MLPSEKGYYTGRVMLIRRPGLRQGLLYKQPCDWLIQSVREPLPPTALLRRHAQTVRIRSFSYKIDYVIVIKNFLNPEGHQNPISYGHFTEGGDFAYWWSFSGGGSALQPAQQACFEFMIFHFGTTCWSPRVLGSFFFDHFTPCLGLGIFQNTEIGKSSLSNFLKFSRTRVLDTY